MNENGDQAQRVNYRYKHHYYRLLKYWPDYQEKFAYLDSKGQALVTFAGILSASFLLVAFEGWGQLSDNSANTSLKYSIACASIGFLMVVLSISALLLTFRTSVGSDDRKYAKLFSLFEKEFDENEGLDREAQIDLYLGLRLKLLQSTLDDRNDVRDDISKLLSDDLAKVSKINATADGLFLSLRDSVEAEVLARHKYYHVALKLTGSALAFLTISLGALYLSI